MDAKNLLKEFVDLTLTEDAVDATRAAGEGLGLLVFSKSKTKSLVLFDVKKAAIAIKNGGQKDDYQEVIEPSIMGFIVVAPAERGPQWGALSVKAVAAQKGYGPLVYDIAMSMFGKIAPDRMSVSPSAQQVWAHYAKKRSDITRHVFDDIKNPQTPDPQDDAYMHPGGTESPLNAAYSGATVDTSGLQKNAQKLLTWAEKGNIGKDSLMHSIQFAGHKFFSKRT